MILKKLNYEKTVFNQDVIDKFNEMILVLNKVNTTLNRLSKKINKKPKILKPKVKVIKQIVKVKDNKSIKCPKCKSKNIIKRGKRYNLNRGYTQRYGCKDCDYKFVPKGMEYRMRVSEVKLKKVFELFNQGHSYSQIAKKVGGVSRQTICRWLKKYKIPKQDRVFEREMTNQYGTYKRKFNIKYKHQGGKNATTKR